MKKLFLLLVFFQVSVTLFSQKEVYFADKPRDSVSISPIQGIQISPRISFGTLGLNIPVGLGYFNELKLGSTTSLILSGNIQAVKAIKSFSIITDYNGYYTGADIVYQTGIKLAVEAEPRWYFDFKNRYMTGKNTKLNSGFFLSLPCEISTNPLAKTYPFQIHLTTSASFGYRHAFSDKFFIESSANLGITLSDFKYFSTVSPYLGLKAAYTFK